MTDRSNTKEDYILNELQDQNNYLLERLQLLKVQKTRNENEIKKLTKKNVELQKLRDDMRRQIFTMMKAAKDWDNFRTELTYERYAWDDMVEVHTERSVIADSRRE